MLAEGQRLTKSIAVLVDDLDLGGALGESEGLLHRLGEPLADPLSSDEPIDDHLDGVLLIASQ